MTQLFDRTEEIPVVRSFDRTEEIPVVRPFDRPARRPRRRRRAPWGRRLRVLAGIDEPLLDKVPSERARYTALGGVVLGTASIATFSMWMAINEALGGFSLLFLLPALLWGVFILNLDRWLVSSAAGVNWGPRITLLLGRLLLAAFFGLIIAEPVVLRVFQTAIEQHVGDSRDASVRDLASTYVRCNPVPDSPAAAADQSGCGQYRLNVKFDPGSVGTQLTADRTAISSLQATIDAETAQQKVLGDAVFAECAGQAGAGFSGKAGDGPLCDQRKSAAAQYAKTHPVAQQEQHLASLNSEADGLQTSLAGQQSRFVGQRSALIQTRTDEQRSHQKQIGLLERFQALSDLTAQNSFLGAAKWALTLFFIMVDCLPVLGKLLGGITAYDRLVARETTTATTAFDAVCQGREGAAQEELRINQMSSHLRLEKLKDQMNVEQLRHETKLNQTLDEEIESLARQREDEIRRHQAASGV
ncbi:MAG TPA: DUF4407 domain-containing protein [Pseudonocardiaceae bacterium]|nr:DUF4407 domain-containing protein [Pseudonocardiaceae bacterium]